MKRILFLLMLMACSTISTFAITENVPIEEKPKKVIDPNKPRAPARINVEAWLEDNLLTIHFCDPEGEASLTLESLEGDIYEELSFSTDAPIMVDLTSYPTVSTFTLQTEAGHTYIGYLF